MRSLRVFRITAIIAGVVLTLVGCESPSSAIMAFQEDAGRVLATVSGAVQASFEGTGYFSRDPDSRLGVPQKFQLISRGMGPSKGASLYGDWLQGGIPPVGTYQVVVPEWGATSADGFRLFFEFTDENRRDNYAASSGTLTITSSSLDRIEGHFEAEAWLVCSLPTSDPCPDLNGTLSQTQRIELKGSFILVPWDPNAVTPE